MQIQYLCHAVVEQSVTAVIDRPRAASDDIPYKFRSQFIMLRRNGLDPKRSGISDVANLHPTGNDGSIPSRSATNFRFASATIRRFLY